MWRKLLLCLPVINVFDAHSLALLGQVPDVALQVVGSQIEDVDSTQLLSRLATAASLLSIRQILSRCRAPRQHLRRHPLAPLPKVL